MITINKQTYPKICEAFQSIEADNGEQYREEFYITNQYPVDEIEAFLVTLSKEDFDDMTMGHHDLKMVILDREGPIAGRADTLLGDFFEGIAEEE